MGKSENYKNVTFREKQLGLLTKSQWIKGTGLEGMSFKKSESFTI